MNFLFSSRCLITFFNKAHRIDLIDKLEKAVKLEWYGSYLKKEYDEFSSQVSAKKWLPSLTQKIFKLAIIKKEINQLGRIDDELVRKVIRGHVDDILLEKSPVELENILRNVIIGERRVVLIDGAPGSGKSTLSIHICQEWSSGKLFTEFTLVIFVQLCNPNIQGTNSIAELLRHEDRSEAKRAAAEITAVKGGGVLWILDGYDELPSHLPDESIISTLIKPNLYKENPLSKSTVIVTSRPISSGDLCPLVFSRIEILGFTTEEQRRFFTECLKDDTKAADTLMERLSSNPAMEGSSYLPLNASIIAHLYLTTGSLPSTIYGIFSSLVQHCLSRYLHERKKVSVGVVSFESFEELPQELQSLFSQLCKLAFTGARNNMVTFSSHDLDSLGVSKDICKLGLLQAVPSFVPHGRSVYHNFLHLSIQQMLAALHISRMSASEQISTFNSMFNDAWFSAVLQFYAAITKLHTSRPLLSLVPRFLRPVPASIYDLIRKVIRKRSKTLLLSLFNCLYEAQDTASCKYVGEQLRNKLPFRDRISGSGFAVSLEGLTLSPQDCLSIGYFLASIAVSFKGKFKVDLDSCSLGDTGVKILMQSLCRSLDPHSEMFGHIDLDIIGNLDMDIGRNNITGEGASYIAEALGTSRVALKRLTLRANPIGDKGLKYIAEAMKTNTSLHELNLSNCSLTITGESGPILTEMLQRNKTLRELKLAYNEAISDNQTSFITEGLKRNITLKILNLWKCNITNEGIQLLQSSTSTCEVSKAFV